MAIAQAALMRLDQYITLKMREYNVPAVSIALTDAERTFFLSTDGVADVAARTPVVPDTVFEIGSISKSFTAIALLQEVEAGRLNLHAPLVEYLPWFAVQSPYDAPITPHHLLTHTAGIITGQNFAAGHHYEVYALRETHVSTPPGTHFHYSDVGYKVLGLLLEHLTGKPYPQVIEERILDPLGMEATAPVITHTTRKRMAVGYSDFYDDRPAPTSRPLAPAAWLQYGGADGSIASTPGDMAIYVRMLLNRGKSPNGSILSEDSFALMTEGYSNAWNDPSLQYGYGLVISQIDGVTHIGHQGGMVGYSSAMLLDMEHELGIVLLANHPVSQVGDMADFGLKTQRAGRYGGDVPPLPSWGNPLYVQNAVDYAGTYGNNRREITFVAEDDRLILNYDYDEIILETRGQDHFYVPHPDFALHLLVFGRDADGRVSEVFYGGDHYTNLFYTPFLFDTIPAEWEAYLGSYRSHNPWLTNFRIIGRKGQLCLIEPSGYMLPLTPIRPNCFRMGADEYSPEWIQFDTFVEGKALRADYSGCAYYRFFTE